MKTHLPACLLFLLTAALLAAGCAPSTQSSTAGDEPAEATPSLPEPQREIPAAERARLEKAFCAETLDYLANSSDEKPLDDCKGVIMRRTDQFGHGDNEGYLVTVIVGEDRKKIELGAVVTPTGEVKLRSLQSGLDRAAVQEAEIGIRNTRSLVDTFYLRTEPQRLPDTLEELVDQDLTDEVPTDPWGNTYIYKKESTTEFTVFSAGPDGQADTLDDVRVE
jgi:hypothetical protein